MNSKCHSDHRSEEYQRGKNEHVGKAGAGAEIQGAVAQSLHYLRKAPRVPEEVCDVQDML